MRCGSAQPVPPMRYELVRTRVDTSPTPGERAFYSLKQPVKKHHEHPISNQKYRRGFDFQDENLFLPATERQASSQPKKRERRSAAALRDDASLLLPPSVRERKGSSSSHVRQVSETHARGVHADEGGIRHGQLARERTQGERHAQAPGDVRQHRRCEPHLQLPQVSALRASSPLSPALASR